MKAYFWTKILHQGTENQTKPEGSQRSKHQFIKLNLRKGQFSKNQETPVKLHESNKEVPCALAIKEKQLKNHQQLVVFLFSLPLGKLNFSVQE